MGLFDRMKTGVVQAPQNPSTATVMNKGPDMAGGVHQEQPYTIQPKQPNIANWEFSPNEASYYAGIYPIDYVAEARLRQAHVTNPALLQYDSLAPYAGVQNQQAQIQTDMFEGVEAWDYQNPYVWMARSVLTIATLQPRYGISSDTPASVLANIQNTVGWIDK